MARTKKHAPPPTPPQEPITIPVFASFEVCYGRKPEPYRDYDPDAPMDGDEYEYLTGTGAYAPPDLPKRPSVQMALWRQRVMQLADERHLTGTAKLIFVTPSGQEHWSVPSGSAEGTAYDVARDRLTGNLHCSCPAWSPCSHMGAVLHAVHACKVAESRPLTREEADMYGAALDVLRGWAATEPMEGGHLDILTEDDDFVPGTGR